MNDDSHLDISDISIACPNCGNYHLESEMILSFLTDSLLCCPDCKGKSKHKVSIGGDPALVYNEIESRLPKE